LNKGDKVQITGNEVTVTIKNNKAFCWLKANHNGKSGYIYSEFVSSDYIYKIDSSYFKSDNISYIGVYSQDIATYQINLFILAPSIKLYTYDLVEAQIVKNDQTLEYVPDMFGDFYDHPFVISNNEVKKLCPVYYKSNQYFALEDQVTTFYEVNNNSEYYLKYLISINETNYKIMPYIIIPIPVIYEKKGDMLREIWKSNSIIKENSAIYHFIKAVSYTSGLFLIDEITKYDVYQSHGSYSDTVYAYKIKGNKLEIVSKLNLSTN
jgi:hypothetical protein